METVSAMTAADAGRKTLAENAGTEADGSQSDYPFEWVFNQSCEPSTQADTCDRCSEEKCCETFEAIRGTDGPKVSRCVIDCTEQKVPFGECWQRCDAQFPGGTEPFATYNACAEQFCSGKSFGCGNPPSDCESCLHESCGREWIELMSTREGLLWFTCNGDCTPLDSVCYTKCFELYPGAQEALKNMTECQASQCPLCASTMFSSGR